MKFHEQIQPERMNDQNLDHIEEAFQRHKEKKAKRESDRAKYGLYEDPNEDYSNNRTVPGEHIMFPTKPNKVRSCLFSFDPVYSVFFSILVLSTFKQV